MAGAAHESARLPQSHPHLAIHEDVTEIALLHEVQSLLAVGGFLDDTADLAQQGRGQQSVGRVVVNHQDPGGVRDWARFWSRACGGMRLLRRASRDLGVARV